MRAGNGRVESVFLCVCSGVEGRGFQKAKDYGILSGDHPSYESVRLAEVLLYLHSLGNYKSPEVRTSVKRHQNHLRQLCSLVFLKLIMVCLMPVAICTEEVSIINGNCD